MASNCLLTSSQGRVKESWGRYVEYVLTRKEYRSLGVEHNLCTHLTTGGVEYEHPDNKYNFQFPCDRDDEYTPVFIDLYDTQNQYAYQVACSYGIGVIDDYTYPNDIIHDFPPTITEDYVFSSTTFAQIKQKLNTYATTYPTNNYGVSVSSINDIFKVYDD